LTTPTDNIRIPDPKAPRFRKKRLNILERKFFRRLKKESPSLAALSDSDIRNIIETFHKSLWQAVIDCRDGVELPEQLGHIFVGTCPPKKSVNKNYHVSNRYKTLVQHRNFESDQHVAKIFYTTFLNKYRFKNHDLWVFTGCREFTRGVSRVYPERWNMYLKIDPMIKINTMFRSNYRKLSVKDAQQDFLETYNELEI
jgi:hypothetical protein